MSGRWISSRAMHTSATARRRYLARLADRVRHLGIQIQQLQSRIIRLEDQMERDDSADKEYWTRRLVVHKPDLARLTERRNTLTDEKACPPSS